MTTVSPDLGLSGAFPAVFLKLRGQDLDWRSLPGQKETESLYGGTSICSDTFMGKRDLIALETRDVRAKPQKQQHLGTR